MYRLLFLLSAIVLGTVTAGAAEPAVHHHKVVVFFQSWSADIDEAAQLAVDDAVAWMKEHPRDTVHVTGFASTVGGKRANMLLADLRAQVVADRLVARGVAADRLHLAGRGATHFVENPLESRRVEVSLDGH
jgi:outer membrane protein OmpA-like peptidoglycan-associated protein